MNKFVKSVLTLTLKLSVLGTLNISVAHAVAYKIEPISDIPSHEYTYGQSQNGTTNEYALSATESYNFPVLYQYLTAEDLINIINLSLNAESFIFGLEPIQDVEALISGNPTGNDLAWVVYYLEQRKASLQYQKVGDVAAFYDLGSGPQKLTVWDEPFSLQYPELSRSTEDYFAGINNAGWFYGSGSAPSKPYTYQGEDNNYITYWLSDFSLRAFVSTNQGGTIIPVPAPLMLYGGVSAIQDMAEVEGKQVAVGYGSIGYNENIFLGIESPTSGGCNDPSIANAIIKQACIETLRDGLNNNNGTAGLYYLGALKWTFNDQGIVVDTEYLGSLITPHVDDKRYHVSHALAVNSSGVAVGFATGWYDETETNPAINEPVSTYAVMYRDGEVFDFTPDHSEWFFSRANDINDAGIAVGHAVRYNLGVYRSKYFYIDTNKEELTMIFPDDFYAGSSSTARAINDNGLIVGEGEVERHSNQTTVDVNGNLYAVNNPRRRNAFLYDTKTDTFTNLNDFLECNTGYEIIEARDINNLDEITATALIKVPRKDAKGDLVVDAEGNTVYEDVVRNVKLTPIAGEPQNCDAEEGKLIERNGATFSWLIMLLSGMFIFRRKYPF